ECRSGGVREPFSAAASPSLGRAGPQSGDKRTLRPFIAQLSRFKAAPKRVKAALKRVKVILTRLNAVLQRSGAALKPVNAAPKRGNARLLRFSAARMVRITARRRPGGPAGGGHHLRGATGTARSPISDVALQLGQPHFTIRRLETRSHDPIGARFNPKVLRSVRPG